MLILAGRSLIPLNSEELGRWLTVGYERGMRFRNGKRDRRVRQWGCSDRKQESPVECSPGSLVISGCLMRTRSGAA
jgi:hypothetical protein